MAEEFNLSEKIGNPTSNDYVDGCLKQGDIKEFIKRLKAGTKLRQMIEGHSSIDFIFNNFIKDIDVLAGDKLI